MSRLSRIRRGFAARGNTLADPDEWLVQSFTGGRTYSGKAITPKTALGLAPYWRGVTLLAGAVGGLPCKVYRPTADGQVEVSRNSRPWQLFHDVPNRTRLMAADEFWSITESHLDTWGNGFSWKERGPDGRVANLWPQDPSKWAVGTASDGSRRYIFNGDLEDPYTDADILHFRALSLDGVIGYSPVQVHRQTLATEAARQEFGGRFWENDATPGVTLIHPNKIPPEAISRIRALWDDRHKGGVNRRKTAVLAENIAVHQMTMPLEDAQFIEQARLSATQQALILGLPPHFVAGDNGGNSLTYSTVEGEGMNLLKWTLAPRLVRLQNTVTHDPDIMPSSWFAEFDPGAVLRATVKESYDALAVARWMTVDEKRKKSGLPPLPDGSGEVLDTGMTPAAASEPATDAEPEANGLVRSNVVPIQRRLGA